MKYVSAALLILTAFACGKTTSASRALASKFAAALQPVLIRIEVQGSHGYRPTDRLIAERADQWAFAAAQVGMR